MSYATEAVELIKDIGVEKLARFDGCLCSQFSIRGFTVYISCRKSPAGIDKLRPDFRGTVVRVTESDMYPDAEGLRAIAEEVVRQVSDDAPCVVRYCDCVHDINQTCTYCEKPRENVDAYLCNKCADTNNAVFGSISERYDLRKYEFTANL